MFGTIAPYIYFERRRLLFDTFVVECATINRIIAAHKIYRKYKTYCKKIYFTILHLFFFCVCVMWVWVWVWIASVQCDSMQCNSVFCQVEMITHTLFKSIIIKLWLLVNSFQFLWLSYMSRAPKKLIKNEVKPNKYNSFKVVSNEFSNKNLLEKWWF